MSTAEKAVLTSVVAQPPPSVHEVQPQTAPAPDSKPWWQKLAVPALVLFLAGAVVAIENNRRQRELQDARIERALAGIDQANAQRLG